MTVAQLCLQGDMLPDWMRCTLGVSVQQVEAHFQICMLHFVLSWDSSYQFSSVFWESARRTVWKYVSSNTKMHSHLSAHAMSQWPQCYGLLLCS